VALSTNSNVNANSPGSYTITYSATDASGNASSVSRTVVVQDTIAPAITMIGNATLTNECHSAFVDPGATVSDACDLSVALSTNSNVNANSPGSYTITYSATDASGNASSVSRTVVVQDTIAPAITMIGNATVTNECHSAFVDPGATVSDACDTAVALSTNSNVNANSPGSYTITYSATDASGNASSVSRTVVVQDTIAPAITMIGNATVTNECHSAFVDPGATVSDACDISVALSTNSNVNANSPGSYTITYSATDASGNASSVSRTVVVQDTIAPTITCSPNITVFTTNVAGTAVTFSTTAEDDCSGTVTPVCNPPSGSNFAIGTNTVTCTATDASGNASTCSFTVAVVLNHAPVTSDSNMGAVEDHSRSILIEKLLTNDYDLDDDALTIIAVSTNSAQGGTVVLGGTSITYLSATNFVGTDTFTYTVGDGHGGIATATVTVQVTSESDPSLNRIGGITMDGNGHVHVRFAGIPGYTYTMERSTDLTNWASIGTFTVGDDGIADFEDANPPVSQAFYRTVSQ
ncbi:MAG: DUF5011 domain-containing protein, partial [Verrucomicrobia bacterium]